MRLLCPICQSASKTFLKKICFESFDSAILPSEYDIVSCNQCGFVYDDLEASKDDFDRYYQQQNKYETKGITGSGDISDLDKKRYEQYIDFLSPYLSADSRIIDIGCGQGGFLHTLKEHGYHNLLAVDPSPHCVSMIQNKEIEAICSTLDDLNINETFDLVCMTAVLEHIYDLRTAVRIVSKLAGSRGYIFADVPDASRYVDYFLAPLYRYDQEHINHFSLVHLDYLFQGVNATLARSVSIELQVSQHHVIPTIWGYLRRTPLPMTSITITSISTTVLNLKRKLKKKLSRATNQWTITHSSFHWFTGRNELPYGDLALMRCGF